MNFFGKAGIWGGLLGIMGSGMGAFDVYSRRSQVDSPMAKAYRQQEGISRSEFLAPSYSGSMLSKGLIGAGLGIGVASFGSILKSNRGYSL